MTEIKELEMKIRVLASNQIADLYYLTGRLYVLAGFVALLGLLCLDPEMWWMGRALCALAMVGAWVVGGMSIAAANRQTAFPPEADD